jgi:hypothetical protein
MAELGKFWPAWSAAEVGGGEFEAPKAAKEYNVVQREAMRIRFCDGILGSRTRVFSTDRVKFWEHLRILLVEDKIQPHHETSCNTRSFRSAVLIGNTSWRETDQINIHSKNLENKCERIWFSANSACWIKRMECRAMIRSRHG